MKVKRIYFFAMLLIILLLSACSKTENTKIEGEIVDVTLDVENKLDSFVVETEDKKQISFLMTEDTRVTTWLEDITNEEFLAGDFTSVKVSVEVEGKERLIEKTDGTRIEGYAANTIDLIGCLLEEQVILSNGTELAVWVGMFSKVYLLPDGTVLLEESIPTGPKNDTEVGSNSFQNLNINAQAKILEFYKKQGLLYDVKTELEDAYKQYCQHKDDGMFQSYHLEQETFSTASSEKIIYYNTTANHHLDCAYYYEVNRSVGFNKETGESVELWDLFQCSKEQAQEKMLELAGIEDQAIREEIKEVFDEAILIFDAEGVYIKFPYDSLSGEGYARAVEQGYLSGCSVIYTAAPTETLAENYPMSYTIEILYNDGMEDLLKEWAIPKEF